MSQESDVADLAHLGRRHRVSSVEPEAGVRHEPGRTAAADEERRDDDQVQVVEPVVPLLQGAPVRC